MKRICGILIASALIAVVLCPMTFGADRKTSYNEAVNSYSQQDGVTVISDEPVPLAGASQANVPGPGMFLLWTAGLAVVAFAGDRMLRKAHFVFYDDMDS